MRDPGINSTVLSPTEITLPIYYNDDKVIETYLGGRNLWETAGKLWTGRLAPSSRPGLLTDGCLLVPDQDIGSKGIFKF